MKFLLNMNLPRQLGKRLTEAGHPSRHVADLGMACADDLEIVEEARRSEETILTHDLDYGHLLAFEGARHPSVVIFRLRNTHPSHLFTQLMTAMTDVEGPLTKGAIVVFEEGRLRIRPLPIVLTGK